MMTLADMAAELSLIKGQLSKQAEALGQHRDTLTQHESALSELGPMAQEVHRHSVILQPAKSSSIVTRQDAEQLYGPKTMQRQLASGGVAPLPLSGLQGAAAQSQAAAIPQVPSLPELGNPNYKPGSGIVVNVAKQGNFRRGATGWEPLAPSLSEITAAVTSVGSLGGSSPSGGGGTGGSFTNPMTTLGDTIYENVTPAPTRLAGNVSALSLVMTQAGTGSVSAPPVWGFVTSTSLIQTGETTSIGPTSIRPGGSVLPAGEYAIFYTLAVSPTGAASVTLTFSYTDPRTGSQSVNVVFSGSSSGNQNGSYAVNLDGSHDLQVTGTLTGIATYDIRVFIVRLS